MARRPMLPEAQTIDGTETIIIRKTDKPFRVFLSKIIGALYPKLRIERYISSTNAQGIATITFATPFKEAPDVQVITGWSNDQMLAGGVTNVTTTGCTVQVMISRGNLLLSAGPFQKATANVNVTVRAMGY